MAQALGLPADLKLASRASRPMFEAAVLKHIELLRPLLCWLYPMHVTKQKIATTTTDDCGHFQQTIWRSLFDFDPLAPEHQPGTAPSSTSGADASSTPTATRATTPTGTKVASPKGTLGPGTAPPATGTSEEGSPGFLTIYCKPACDSVTAGGRGLGASPVSNVPMPPGQHRVTCKRSGSPTKVISVIIVSGQLTSHTVTME